MHTSESRGGLAGPSRGIVVFKDNTCLVWEAECEAVEQWAMDFDKPSTEYGKFAIAHGGLFHAVVYTVRTGFVAYETEH